MMYSYKRLSFVVALIVSAALVFSTCMHPSSSAGEKADPRGEAYAGSVTCQKCHKSVCDGYERAAHSRTSRAAAAGTILGSFEKPANRYTYRPGMEVTMERRDSGLFQVTTIDGKETAHRFDVVMGSGRKAQTYLYWVGDQPYELPVSYFVTTHSWANSPGFPTDHVKFDRTIPVLCFECHSSFIQKKAPIRVDAFNQIDQLDKAQVVYGIDCERCHGPAAKHIAWQEEHPQDHSANYIARVSMLTRQQKLDMCALCHSGSHKMQRSSFGFKPGDHLDDYYYPESRIAATPATMDVHGNQYQLLMASKCMLRSKTLDCTSCHNPHVKERDNLALFSQRCMNCHKIEEHPASSLGTAVLAANCIDCHMPAKDSKIITLQTEGQKDPVADKVRSHYIAIYPEETKKFLAAMKH